MSFTTVKRAISKLKNVIFEEHKVAAGQIKEVLLIYLKNWRIRATLTFSKVILLAQDFSKIVLLRSSAEKFHYIQQKFNAV